MEYLCFSTALILVFYQIHLVRASDSPSHIKSVRPSETSTASKFIRPHLTYSVPLPPLEPQPDIDVFKGENPEFFFENRLKKLSENPQGNQKFFSPEKQPRPHIVYGVPYPNGQPDFEDVFKGEPRAIPIQKESVRKEPLDQINNNTTKLENQELPNALYGVPFLETQPETNPFENPRFYYLRDARNEQSSKLQENQGVYYIYHGEGVLQKVTYTKGTNESGNRNEQNQYEKLEPIKDPVYMYDRNLLSFKRLQ